MNTIRCPKCGGELEDYKPVVETVVDYVPYGDRNVPMVNHFGSEATFICTECDAELEIHEIYDAIEFDEIEELFSEEVPDHKQELACEIMTRLTIGSDMAISAIKGIVEDWEKKHKKD